MTARNRVPDFPDLALRATKVAFGLPTQTALKNAEVNYLFSFPWSRSNDGTLVPHAVHLGCWAVIGNAGQDLRFTVDSDTAQHKHIGHVLCRNTNLPSVEYKVNVAFVQKRLGSTSTWHMDIELFDKPLDTLQHDVRP